MIEWKCSKTKIMTNGQPMTSPMDSCRESEMMVTDRHGDRMTVGSMLWKRGWRDKTLEGKGLAEFDASSDTLGTFRDYAQAYVAGKVDRPGLLLIGPPGTGKTHLARGIARGLACRGVSVWYGQLQEVVARSRDAINRVGDSPEREIRWIIEFPGVVFLDEVGRSKGTPWDRDNILYPIVDGRKSLPTVYIANYDLPEVAERYDSAIASRLSLCRVMRFKGLPDRRRAR